MWSWWIGRFPRIPRKSSRIDRLTGRDEEAGPWSGFFAFRAMSSPDIFFFTDFGVQGPYLGLMEAAVANVCAGVRVVNLMCDAPRHDPRRAAYLLAALEAWLPTEAIVVAVVDPGVGSDRGMLALEADDRWFLGPDNGLLSRVGRSARNRRLWVLEAEPDARLSASFHGRDVFAPAAARLACGNKPRLKPRQRTAIVGQDWPDSLPEVLYIDHFGNAMTGISPADLPPSGTLVVNGRKLTRVRTFSDVAPGEPLCYENSLGLLEIAVNGGSAAAALGLRIGSCVSLFPG